MSLLHRWFCLLVIFVDFVISARHDELSQCGLAAIYKARQSELLSPKYPENYPGNICWDYVVRSPFRCPTTFHVQFLQFDLAMSPNCSRDYLAIGLDPGNDDYADILCGEVIGIKKYRTPNGILRFRFFSDNSPRPRGKGFKLLITRLACEQEDFLRSPYTNGESNVVTEPVDFLQPPQEQPPAPFYNLSALQQHNLLPQPVDLGWRQQVPKIDTFWLYSNSDGESNIVTESPNYLLPPREQQATQFYDLNALQHHRLLPRPSDFSWQQQTPKSNEQVEEAPQQPIYPSLAGENSQCVDDPTFSVNSHVKPCRETTPSTTSIIDRNQVVLPPFYLSAYHTYQQLPELSDQYPRTAWNNRIQRPIPQLRQTAGLHKSCCTSTLRRRQFYLSSPGFQRTVLTSLLPTHQRDCQFHLERANPNVCGLRISFKFFDFGQSINRFDAHIQDNVEDQFVQECLDDFVEIDNKRFCGCRSGYVHSVHWPPGSPTLLRLRMGYSTLPSAGFLLDITQEECGIVGNITPQGQSAHLPFGVHLNDFQAVNNRPSSRFTDDDVKFPPSLQQMRYYRGHPAGAILPEVIYNFNRAASDAPAQLYWSQLLQPFRQSRSAIDIYQANSDDNPYNVVVTNSSRKEFYFFDGDDVKEHRTRQLPTLADPNGDGLVSTSGRLSSKKIQRRCTFDTSDILNLSTEELWQTKPICYAP